jgi:hypothetical protein
MKKAPADQQLDCLEGGMEKRGRKKVMPYQTGITH